MTFNTTPSAEVLKVFETVPNMYLVLSRDLIILTASDLYLEATLTTREKLVGRHIFEAFPDNPDLPDADGVKNIRASLERVLATRKPDLMAIQHYDVPHPSLPGVFVERYWMPSHTPVLDARGEVSYIIQLATNITETISANHQLRANQDREIAILAEVERQRTQLGERETLFQVFEQTPAAICLQRGPEHRYVFVNAAYQALFPDRKFEHRPVAEALPETVPQGFVALLDAVYRTGETFFGRELPVTLTPADGGAPRTIYFNFTYQAYREKGEIVGIATFAYEVSEQVEARREADRQRHLLHDLFMEAPAAICILDGPDLIYQLINPTYQQLFPGRSLLGRPLAEALPELAGHEVMETFRRVYQTGVTHREEGMLAPIARPEDGRLENRYFNYIQQARFDADGQINGILVFAFEVTDQVEARQQAQAIADQLAVTTEELAAANEELAAANEEIRTVHEEVLASNEELAESNDQLRRTNADLDNFIYTASHDLKAPISNIEALLTALLRMLPPESLAAGKVPAITSRMQESVDRFKKTIANLTEVVKLQKENSAEAVPVHLAAVIEAVRLDLETQIATTRATLAVEVAGCPTVRFSEKNLRSVVYNLLSNSLKYRSPDRPLRVDIHCDVTPGYRVLTIADNGLGMETGRLGQLFTMFKRFHDHVEGSGIGLYMVKKMVENAGGKIAVESRVDVGSTFRVYFPA